MSKITKNIRAAFLTLLVLFITPSLVYGLGLSGIKLDSTLDQPLKAQIEILGAKEQDFQGMEVTLASEAVYKRMGIEPNPLIRDLQFAITKSQDGRRAYIDVESPKAISEPFINFLIEVNWNAGRLLREFTVLLDPPLFVEEKAPAVEAPETDLPPSFTVTTESAIEQPATEQVQESMVEEPLPTNEEELSETLEENFVAEAVIENEPGDELPAENTSLVYKEVKKNDYLWNIAESMRPENVSVEQMMLALQKENPHAFYGGTVSQLKEGVVLRIDDTSVLQDVSKDEAISEITRQHQEWLAYAKARQAKNAVAAESSGVELEGSDKPVDVTEASPKIVDQPRLKLVTPVEEQASSKSAETNVSLQAAEKKLNELDVELALATETLEASKQENQDLLNRLDSIGEQMAAMQSLIQLKDAEIQRMQGNNALPLDESEEQITPLVSLDLENDSAADQGVVTQKDIHTSGIQETFRRLINDPVTIATVIFVALFIGLIAWVLTRKPLVVEEEEPIYDEKSIDELFPEDEPSSQRTVFTERVEFAGVDNTEIDESLAKQPLEKAELKQSSEELLDYIAQADVYLSYDKFDKAEELLISAIEKEPENHVYKLKLLEVYTQKNDVGAFDREAEMLFASIDGDLESPLWIDAKLLAEKIGSNSQLFKARDQVEPETSMVSTVKESTPVVEEWQPTQNTEEAIQQPIETPISEDTIVVETETKNTVVKEADKNEISAVSEKTLVSDEELEKAMSSFTDEALEQEESIIEPDKAVTEMLSSLNSSNPDKFFDQDAELDDNGLFLLSDEIGTKLDLAKAYIEMGDQDGARDLLNEVIDEGNSHQQVEAKDLLEHT